MILAQLFFNNFWTIVSHSRCVLTLFLSFFSLSIVFDQYKEREKSLSQKFPKKKVIPKVVIKWLYKYH